MALRAWIVRDGLIRSAIMAIANGPWRSGNQKMMEGGAHLPPSVDRQPSHRSLRLGYLLLDFAGLDVHDCGLFEFCDFHERI